MSQTAAARARHRQAARRGGGGQRRGGAVARWAEKALSSGDRVEIVRPFGGG
jgi:hypothetical protein